MSGRQNRLTGSLVFKMSFWILIFLLGLASNYYYQPLYTPVFNSDQAIWVLMTREFIWPDSLYFWGQNRLGSLIPTLAHILYLFGFKAITALSLVQLIVQMVSLALLYGIKRNYWVVLLFSVALLFPAWPFKEIVSVSHPYLTQIFLFILFLFLLHREQHRSWHLYGAVVVSVLMIWASELSAVFLLVAGFFYRDLWISLERKKLLYLLTATVAGVLLVLIVRNQLPKSPGYEVFFGSFPEMMANLQGFKTTGFLYFYHHSLTIFISYLLVILALVWISLNKADRITKILILSGLLSLMVSLMSHWVFLNNAGARYFCLPVYLFLLGLSMSFSEIPLWGKGFLLLAVSILGWASLDYIKPGLRMVDGRPTRLEMEEIVAQNDACYVLGDYWSVYLFAALESGVKVATIEAYGNRNRWDRNEVLDADSLLVLNQGSVDTLQIDTDHKFIPSGELHWSGQTSYQVYQKLP